MPKYLFLVDESGDAGIEKIRSKGQGGASPYMTLGGVLIAEADAQFARDAMRKVCLEIRKPTLHCKEMRHFQKLHFAKTVAALPIVTFGLISFKNTLGGYKEAIDGNSSKFYNTCARYLLERLGDYMGANSVGRHEVEIIFEEGNFAYDKLRNYIGMCQDRPMGKTTQQLENVKLLKNVSSRNITAKPKADELLLQIPDLVAHALYKCVDKSNACHQITETRYLKEISCLFYSRASDSKIIGTGIKPVHNLSQLRLDADTYSFFNELKA